MDFFPLKYRQNCNVLTVTRNLLFPSILKYSPLNSQQTRLTRRGEGEEGGGKKGDTTQSALENLFSVKRFKKQPNTRNGSSASFLIMHQKAHQGRVSLGQARSWP